jgi:hypothetical protein
MEMLCCDFSALTIVCEVALVLGQGMRYRYEKFCNVLHRFAVPDARAA